MNASPLHFASRSISSVSSASSCRRYRASIGTNSDFSLREDIKNSRAANRLPRSPTGAPPFFSISIENITLLASPVAGRTSRGVERLGRCHPAANRCAGAACSPHCPIWRAVSSAAGLRRRRAQQSTSRADGIAGGRGAQQQRRRLRAEWRQRRIAAPCSVSRCRRAGAASSDRGRLEAEFRAACHQSH